MYLQGMKAISNSLKDLPKLQNVKLNIASPAYIQLLSILSNNPYLTRDTFDITFEGF